MADALEFGLDLAGGDDMAIGHGAKVQPHPGPMHQSSGTSSMVSARSPPFIVG